MSNYVRIPITDPHGKVAGDLLQKAWLMSNHPDPPGGKGGEGLFQMRCAENGVLVLTVAAPVDQVFMAQNGIDCCNQNGTVVIGIHRELENIPQRSFEVPNLVRIGLSGHSLETGLHHPFLPLQQGIVVVLGVPDGLFRCQGTRHHGNVFP